MTPNIDELIVDPRTYANDELFHRLLAEIRREDPVHRVEVEGFTPFWLVSKHADIMEIEKQNDRFINDPLLTLTTTDAIEKTKEFTGGSHLLLRTLVHMDNPDHRAYRALTQAWFMPTNLKKLDEKLSALAREFVDKMEDKGGSCDFVTDVAVWYPLRVIMTILGVDRKDEARMLTLTQELFGAQDPETQRGAGFEDLTATITDFFQFFTALTAERRANPKDDVASVIANATIDGRPIGDLEAMSYYIIVATAGHDTTSSTTAGGLKALIDNPEELAKLRANPALLASAVDEMIRWVTPVKHFMRTATEDYVLRDKNIRKGDHLMMMYPSGNRDEEVFDEPFKFKVDRSPNKHLAFGYGAHLCLGQHLAKMEIKALYTELLARFDDFAITGETANVQASFVSGLKRLPISYSTRPQAA